MRKNKGLLYVTSVKVPAVNAQSVQIMETAKQLATLDSDFKLVLSGKICEEDFGFVNRVSTFFHKGRWRYVEFCIRAFLRYKEVDSVVYSRDIFVCFLFSLVGAEVCYESHQRPTWKAGLLLRFIMSRGARLVVISNSLKSFYLGQYGFAERSLAVIPSAVDCNRYDSAVRLDLHEYFGIDRQQKILLHTGSLYPGRGGELFDYILSSFPCLTIVHVGGGEDYIERIKRMTNDDRFVAKTHVDAELLACFQKSADALLFPMTRLTKTYWCCSPMKLFEYMASGVPLISTNVGSVKEVLTSEMAFLFDPENLESLDVALRAYLNSPDEAKSKAYKSKKLAYSQYGWATRANKIMNFLKV